MSFAVPCTSAVQVLYMLLPGIAAGQDIGGYAYSIDLCRRRYDAVSEVPYHKIVAWFEYSITKVPALSRYRFLIYRT